MGGLNGWCKCKPTHNPHETPTLKKLPVSRFMLKLCTEARNRMHGVVAVYFTYSCLVPYCNVIDGGAERCAGTWSLSLTPQPLHLPLTMPCTPSYGLMGWPRGYGSTVKQYLDCSRPFWATFDRPICLLLQGWENLSVSCTLLPSSWGHNMLGHCMYVIRAEVPSSITHAERKKERMVGFSAHQPIIPLKPPFCKNTQSYIST